MAWYNFRRKAEAREATAETVYAAATPEGVLALFGQSGASLPSVTVDNALTVMPVWAAVTFLSRTLAALPLHAYRDAAEGSVRLTGKTAMTVHEFPNEEMDSFRFREYFWMQVFTTGRGLAYIERKGREVENIWPMNPRKTQIARKGMRLTYTHDGVTYDSSEVIDVPFALKANATDHYSPITQARKAIQLALAMTEYGASFFAGGGVPPLALVGPLPQGSDGLKRSMNDMSRAIDAAKASNKPVFPIPPGHELKQVGYDPAKGQMVEAMRFQTEEIARAYQLPPVFMQDLSRATFSNAEQQDLHFVKHLIGQWAKKLEGEMTLKLFGRAATDKRFVEHNLDGLLRGDLKSRMEALARAIQTGQLTPNEARKLSNRAEHPNPVANDLLVQGAIVPLGTPASGIEPPQAENAGEQNVE
ncbi:phage portal protein [Pseudogemmobacter sonorensis]|uniref:phage portal protein n=1 Tax=Pseudogemmobacter sonorensis TaxID=2989681 RepID=UPI0036869FAB